VTELGGKTLNNFRAACASLFQAICDSPSSRRDWFSIKKSRPSYLDYGKLGGVFREAHFFPLAVGRWGKGGCASAHSIAPAS
jgi:hypothetical protein